MASWSVQFISPNVHICVCVCVCVTFCPRPLHSEKVWNGDFWLKTVFLEFRISAIPAHA